MNPHARGPEHLEVAERLAAAFGLSATALIDAPLVLAVVACGGPCAACPRAAADRAARIEAALHNELLKLLYLVNIVVLEMLERRKHLLEAAGLLEALRALMIDPARHKELVGHVLFAVAARPGAYRPTDASGAPVAFEPWLVDAVECELLVALHEEENPPHEIG